MDRGAWWATVHGVAESNATEQLRMYSARMRELTKSTLELENRQIKKNYWNQQLFLWQYQQNWWNFSKTDQGNKERCKLLIHSILITFALKREFFPMQLVNYGLWNTECGTPSQLLVRDSLHKKQVNVELSWTKSPRNTQNAHLCTSQTYASYLISPQVWWTAAVYIWYWIFLFNFR